MWVKRLAAALVFLVTILLKPVESVWAGRAEGDVIPTVYDFSVEFETKEYVYSEGWFDFDTWESITDIHFRHKKLDNVDYSQYYLVCGITLATMREDGSLEYTDLDDYIGFDDGIDHGFFYDVATWFNSLDGYYDHEFDYHDLVVEAEHGFDKVQLNKYGKEIYTYNTVVSSMKFYFVRQSDEKPGRALVCSFFWDEDFYMQELVGVDYYWTDVLDDGEPEDSEEAGDGEIEKEPAEADDDDWYGVPSLLDEFKYFLLGLPKALYAVLAGVIAFSAGLVSLIKALFPFIPGVIWLAFGGLLVLSICIKIWNFIFH